MEPIQGTLLRRGAGELYLADEDMNTMEPCLSDLLAKFVGHKVRIFQVDTMDGDTQAVIISVVDGVGA